MPQCTSVGVLYSIARFIPVGKCVLDIFLPTADIHFFATLL